MARLWMTLQKIEWPCPTFCSDLFIEQWKHNSFRIALRKLLNLFSQGRILIGIIQLRKYFFDEKGNKIKSQSIHPISTSISGIAYLS